MIGGRWVVLGAVLAGCVFTPRPMIPVANEDADATNLGADAAVVRDTGTATDRGATFTDLGGVPTDTTPPTFDASAAADVPGVAVGDAGAMDGGTPDGSAEADATADCDASVDGGRCADASADVESGVATP